MRLLGALSYSFANSALPIDRSLLIEVLEEATKHDPRGELEGDDFQNFSHYVSQLLDVLESSGATIDELGKLEWAWLPVIRHTQHGFRNLRKTIANDPESYVHLIKTCFKAHNGPARDLNENERAAALQAHQLLDDLHFVPGFTAGETQDRVPDGEIAFPSGTVDEDKLFGWITAARKGAAEADRLEVCDSMIGGLLAFAPAEHDGIWPCVAVRTLIETIASDSLGRGVVSGIFNKRGCHFVEPGGNQETRIAERFSAFAADTRSRWPRTSQLLTSIARDFTHEAKHNIEREKLGEFE